MAAVNKKKMEASLRSMNECCDASGLGVGISLIDDDEGLRKGWFTCCLAQKSRNLTRFEFPI